MPKYDFEDFEEKKPGLYDFESPEPVVPPEEPPAEPSIYERLKGYLTPERVEIPPEDALRERLERPTREPETMMALPGGGVVPEETERQYPLLEITGKMIKDSLFGELPAGAGAIGDALDYWGKYRMTAEEEMEMARKHPNLMAARYAAASVLLPGISEYFASTVDWEEFQKKSIEEQRLDILGTTGAYVVFGAAMRWIPEGLIAAFPGLTKPVIEVLRKNRWFRKLEVGLKGQVLHSVKSMQKAGMTEAQILKVLKKRNYTEFKKYRKKFAEETGRLKGEPAGEKAKSAVEDLERYGEELKAEGERLKAEVATTKVAKEVKAAIREEVKPSPLERLRQREREIAEDKIDFEEPVTVEPEITPEVTKEPPTIEEVPKKVGKLTPEQVAAAEARMAAAMEKGEAEVRAEAPPLKEPGGIPNFTERAKVSRTEPTPEAYKWAGKATKKEYEALKKERAKEGERLQKLSDELAKLPQGPEKQKLAGVKSPREFERSFKGEAIEAYEIIHGLRPRDAFKVEQIEGTLGIKLPEVKAKEVKPALVKEPWEMSQKEFIDYHATGTISEQAYKQYETLEGVAWLGKKEKYPIKIKSQKYGDEVIELRKSDKKLQYVKQDKEGNIVRDKKGLAIPMTEQEMKNLDLPLTETSIVAFNSKGQPVGWAANEFGADGVWVINQYQKRGIGNDLLTEFRKQFEPTRKMGQMTGSGLALVKAHHRRLAKQAIKEGKITSHPDYPELGKKPLKVEAVPKPTTVSQQQKQDTVELFSGIPFHRVDKVIMEPLRKLYQKYVGNPLWNFLSETLPLKAGKKSRIVDRINKGLIYDYRKDPEFIGLRDETQLKIQQYRQKAKELADTMAKFPRAEQIRIAQVIKGGITATPGRYEAALETIKRFEGLTKDLQDLGILGPDNRFRQLSRKEIANKFKEIADLDNQVAKLKGKLKPLMRDRPALIKKIEGLVNKRSEILERIRLHYKMSGKLYLRRAYEKIEAEKKFMNRLLNTLRIRKPRLKKGYDIRRKDLSKEYRKELGEIEQAPFLVYKGLSEETHDVELMRMFVKIAENKDWAISPEEWTNIQQVKARQHLVPKYENFKPLPVTEKLGPLSGALVDPYIWDDLNQAVKVRGDIIKAYDAVLGLWKTGKVVYNPATQARNILSNSILADFADLPQHRIDIYARAARDFYTKSGYWKEATENTPLLGKEWAATEAFDFLKATADLKKGTFPVEAAKLIAKHLDKPKELYGFWEQFFKLAVYTNERLNGVAIKPAYKKAEKHIFNYQKIPPAIRWAKRWYSPFITFSYKAVPLFAETAIRKPWKIVKYGLLMAAVEEITRRLMGESEEEVEWEKKVLPDYMRKAILPGQLAHLRIPYKDEYGRSKYLDFSYILPWGDVAEQWGQSRLAGRPFLPSHPIWISVGEIAFNEILFTGQDLTIKDLDEGSEYWKRIGTQIWRQAMPSLAGSYSYNKLMAAFKGERDWRGRDRSIEEAIFDVFFGLKVRSIDYNEELDRRVGELERHRNELKKRFRRDYRKILMNPTPDPEHDMRRQDKLFEKLSNDLDKILNKIYKLQE